MNLKYIVNYFDNSKTHKQYITTKYNLKYSDYLLNKKHICNTCITFYFNIVMFTIIITFYFIMRTYLTIFTFNTPIFYFIMFTYTTTTTLFTN